MLIISYNTKGSTTFKSRWGGGGWNSEKTDTVKEKMGGLGNGGGWKRREDTQEAARGHVRVPAGRCDSLVHAGNHLKLCFNEAARGG